MPKRRLTERLSFFGGLIGVGFVAILASVACSSDTAPLDANPLLRHQASESADGELALIVGSLSLEGNCLYLSGEAVLFPIVWPRNTRWDSVREAVVLPDGTEVAMGEVVTGTGGYSTDVAKVEAVAGSDAAALVAQCIDSTGGEIAIINNQDDAIELTE